MPQLSLLEQGRLARLTLERTQRRALATLLGSPLLRWRYGAPIADELLIIPQDLRTGDPSFASEIRMGHFGLAGRVAYLQTGSPFDLVPPSMEWARELHGFGWLRHLKAAGDDTARRTAVSLVKLWIDARRSNQPGRGDTAVIGRRLISWIAAAGWLLIDSDQGTYDAFTDTLADQLIELSAIWRDAPQGYPRLLALTALVYGDLCVAGRERRLKDVVQAFGAEIDNQILSDGGHISRDPGILVELMLDFLPLRQCFAAREKPVPPALEQAIQRIVPMLRFMRLGDGTLARFNGMGAPSIDAMATVLAYDPDPAMELKEARASRYVRLARGQSVLIVDCGSPPPLEFAGRATASCMAFEMSIGPQAVFVNGGAPAPADEDWRAASRATASHNTLSILNKSSSKLVRHPLLESMLGAAPIRFPNNVTARLLAAETGITVEASHDGYVRSFGLLHRRSLTLSDDGRRLTGFDSIAPAKASSKAGPFESAPLPFAVHFHLHPNVACESTSDQHAVLRLSDGTRWRLSVKGAALSQEESIHFADLAGPRQSVQLSLRATTPGETRIRWVVEPADAA